MVWGMNLGGYRKKYGAYVKITIQLLLAWLSPFGDQSSSFTLYQYCPY